MLRQMRSLFVKSSNILLTFSHCSTNTKLTLFQPYCTTLYWPFLWNSYKKSTFNKIRVAYNNVYRKFFDLPEKSSAIAMYARHNICSFESMLRKSIMLYAEIRKQY